MPASHFTIRKFSYLKTPRHSVTLHNTEGGSFSLGEQKNLKAAAGHIWSAYRDTVLKQPGLRVIMEDWHGFDENDEPVFTTELTDVDALLSRTGITRGM
jgi:hypothetical protein